MKILLQMPTRQRCDQFFRLLDEYRKRMDTGKPHEFNVICDVDDGVMYNPAVIDRLTHVPSASFYFDEPAGKIAACNAHLRKKEFDILVLASDDMWPIVDGWDDIIRNAMQKHFPDTDGVLWFNDGFQGRRLNTLSIMGYEYYRRFGYVYHPSYRSMWCDNEFMEVAAGLKKQVYLDQVIIEHRHPAANKAKRDKLYSKNLRFLGGDQRNFARRRKAGFPVS